MYCPYLRGKKYELLALEECASQVAASRKLFPIIEPVKLHLTSLAHTLGVYAAHSLRYILVLNPRVGQLQYNYDLLRDAVDTGQLPVHERAYLGYMVTKHTDLGALDGFLNHYRGRNRALIHWEPFSDPQQLLTLSSSHENLVHIFIDRPRGQAYHDLFGGFRRVLVRDGFRRVSNTDYPKDEPFSDLHREYASMAMNGFGDFCTLGKNYTDYAPPPFAVAVHLTYPRPEGEIRVRHFLSNSNSEQGFSTVKIFEALRKLVDFIVTNPMPFSTACDDFRRLYLNSRKISPGRLNGLSVKHHMELMMDVLK